ncbi:Protein ELYS [Apodemus speciosus]|uniref:Protein ELYS n=1 Tax=Apodemus speciosus TaxID=105296 RepID=A0ABQ0EF63_APOSI
MQDLTAQVTSDLLQFPEVTIEALGEDEITLESVLRGKFAAGKNGLACLACGPQLEVVNSLTGERLSAYRFSGVNEQPPVVLAVKEFSWHKRTGLLIGLEEADGSVLCLYDLGISRVVKAVVLPGRVTAIEPIINHGGASASTQHLHSSLRWLFGVAAVVTDIGQILLIDLCLDDLSCSQNEVEASDLEVITGIPAEVPHIRESVMREGRHLCFQLVSPSGVAISTLSYISRTNQLAVGFSDGYLALWNMKSMKREYYTQLEGGRVPVYAVVFQEPENDPRNCCYLWAVQSTQDSEGDVLSLHLLQLAFGDRKCLASGQILYEGLEYCEERYTLDLAGGMFPLRGQTSNTKLLGCQSIERYPSHGDREESMREGRVSLYSPGCPGAHYVDQAGLELRNPPASASQSAGITGVRYHGPAKIKPSDENFLMSKEECQVVTLSPDTSVSVFTWQVNIYGQGKPSVYLGLFDINRWYHAQMPDSLSRTSPHHILDILVHERSLNRGVPPSYPPPEQFFNPSTFNFVCHLFVKLWGYSCNLYWISEGGRTIRSYIVSSNSDKFFGTFDWVHQNMDNRRLCVPLFDGSCRFLDPQTIQSIQQCHLLLSNLSTVLSCFAMEAQGITERGLVDLSNKHMVTQLICQYAQMVLWFCHSGLLPEGLDDALQLSRLRYNYPVIQNYYASRRQKCERSPRGKWNHDCLMIDGLVSQLGDEVEKLWKRDEGGTGRYPPASIHLVQGFWLLDHNDYENGLDLLFHPVTAKPASWQHSKIIEAFMRQGEHKQALRYLQTMKPTVSSSNDVILHLTVLLFNRCMVEAWNLLRQNSNRINIEELLKHAYEVCQEMGLMEDLLKLPFTNTEQECLVKFLQSSTSVENHEFLLVHHLQRANYISALKLNQTLKNNLTSDRDPRLRERSVTRNSILDQYGKILPRVQRKLAVERAKPYHLSTSSVFQEVSRPKPLSAFPKKAVTGTVLTRSTFISNVLSKIGEVWASREPRNGISLFNSPKTEQPPPVVHSLPNPELPEAFVGTPISNTSQRISRLLDLVVHPVPQPSQCLELIQQSPTRSPLCLLSSSLPLSSQLKRPHQNTSRPSELLLLETPLIVKIEDRVSLCSPGCPGTHSVDQAGLELRNPPVSASQKAKSLALSATSSGFAEFTPPSILRSGLRATPLASPSLSPGRSLTPPFRLKETRISFMEEGVDTHWTDRATDDRSAKASVSASFHKCGLPAGPEWMKTSDKNTYFPLAVPAKGPQEVAAESLDTHARSIEKLDVSKEDSTASTRSDQTSLEYHDAPSPEDFEGGVFVSPKPGNSSTERTTNSTLQTERDNDKDLFKSEDTPSTMEKQIGTGDTAVEAFSEFSRLDTVQRAEASLGVSSVCEGFLCRLAVWTSLCRPSCPGPHCRPGCPGPHSVDQAVLTFTGNCLPLPPSATTWTGWETSKTPVLDGIVSTESRTSVLRADHKQSVAHTVEDVESSGSITSKCPVTSERSLDQKLTLSFREDEIDANVPKEDVGLPEERPQISAGPSDTQEIHLIGCEKLEVQNSEEEAKNLSFNELYPVGAHTLQYTLNTIEQQFCDLPDDKDSAECDVAEVDGELFVAQSNFSLILEGEEGEVEASDSAAPNVLVKAANIATKEKPVSILEPRDQEHVTDLPPAVTATQASHKVETLPYVPEPVKVAIAENLLDVIKDTRSKEATRVAADEAVDVDRALITPKAARSSRSTNSTLKTVKEPRAETLNTSQRNDVVSSRTLTRRQHALSLNVTSEQEPSEIATPKRKTRKIKETPEFSESSCSEIPVAPEKQLTAQSPAPQRGKRKGVSRGALAGSGAVEQEPQRTPERLRLRAQPPQPAAEETPSTTEVKPSSVRKRTPGRRKKSVENGQSAEIVNDLEDSKAASHGGTVKALRNASLQDAQNTECKQDEHSDQQLPLKRKRARERASVSSETEEPKLASSPLPLQTGLDVPATPRKRGRPSRVVPLDADGATAGKEQKSPQKKDVPVVRRSARNTPARNVSTLEKSTVVPSKEAAAVMTPKRKPTKKSAEKSSVADETAQQEATGHEERLLATATLTQSSWGTRTRSRRTMVSTDISEPKIEPLFSPPSVKVPKKKAKETNHRAAENMEATAQLKELVSDLSSQFVVSPPALRTRQKSISSTSKLLSELVPLESDPKPLEIIEQKPKRSRTAKPKASRNTGKGRSWSPPPVEIKLVSPLASPVDEIKISKPRKTAEVAGKTLGRGRKKPSSFPKQILRRKML